MFLEEGAGNECVRSFRGGGGLCGGQFGLWFSLVPYGFHKTV